MPLISTDRCGRCWLEDGAEAIRAIVVALAIERLRVVPGRYDMFLSERCRHRRRGVRLRSLPMTSANWPGSITSTGSRFRISHASVGDVAVTRDADRQRRAGRRAVRPLWMAWPTCAMAAFASARS